MNNTFYFSVIIPTYNRRDILEETLEALEHQTLDKELYELIVVDDGSTDETADLLERYKNRAKLHFTYISKKNEGQGIARNRGFDVSDGHIVLFLGDDIIPKPDFLAEHKKVHDKFATENFIVLGHTTWHPDLEINSYMRFLEKVGMQFKYDELEKAKLIDPLLGVRLATYKHFYTSNISLKRSLFEKQRFDERFKKYGWEDIELGKRLEEEEGAVILYTNKARAHHMHQLEPSELEKRMVQIGKNAYRAHKINPRLGIVPGPLKRIAFWLFGLPPITMILKKLYTPKEDGSLQFFEYWYYYSLMKRYFLKGLRKGRKK